MNIYRSNSYRLIIKSIVEERKRLDPSINFQRLAEYCRVPKSYISKVIRGNADLNCDQLFLACRFLKLKDGEYSYMQLLLDHARCSLKARREILAAEIKLIQEKNLETQAHLENVKEIPRGQDNAQYYFDPDHQLVHIALSIPRYQADQTLLAKDLGIPTVRLAEIIDRLEQMRIINRNPNSIQLLVESMHLAKDAPVYRAWRNQVKLRSIQRLERLTDDRRGYSFTALFSADEDIRKELQARFLTFLKEAEELVRNGSQEEVYQMGFDLFPWT